MNEFYEGQQFVGMDLHRRRSVLVRMTETGEHLETVRIVNTRDGTVNLRSCGRSANHISLIRHTRPGESRRRTGENRPRIDQVDSADQRVN